MNNSFVESGPSMTVLHGIISEVCLGTEYTVVFIMSKTRLDSLKDIMGSTSVLE